MIANLNRLALICFSTLLCAYAASASRSDFTLKELSGVYSVGSRWGGSTLAINYDGHFARSSSDCTTEYLQLGTASLDEGVLRFTILKETARAHGSDKEEDLLDPQTRRKFFVSDEGEEIVREFKLVPIRWSDRTYLVSDTDLRDFATAINMGLEPRSELSADPYFGSFYLRNGDEQKAVRSTPTLPAQWTSFLLTSPVTATVVALKGNAEDLTATIDKGSRDGLKVGMRMLAKGEDPVPWSGNTIVSVAEASAVVSLVQGLQVGEQLTTKFERKDRQQY